MNTKSLMRRLTKELMAFVLETESGTEITKTEMEMTKMEMEITKMETETGNGNGDADRREEGGEEEGARRAMAMAMAMASSLARETTEKETEVARAGEARPRTCELSCPIWRSLCSFPFWGGVKFLSSCGFRVSIHFGF
jgi:hypothetical protein